MDWKPFEDYLRSKTLGERTIYEYRNYFRKLSNAIGDLPLSQEIVNAYLSDNKNIVCRAMLKNYLHHIRDRDIELPKISGRPKRDKIVLIPKQHIDWFRQYFYAKRTDLGFMFDLALHGALRREEVVNIRLRDFNLTELQSNPDSAYVKMLVRRGKGNKQRNIVLPNLLLKGILLYAGEEKIGLDEKLFKMGRRVWWRHFNTACMDMGFYKEENGKKIALYHPHSIRHSKSSEWYESGVDIVKIQQRLGHADISTTRLYITPDEKKAEMEWSEEYK